MLLSTMPEALAREKGYYPVGGCGGNIAWHTEDDTLEIADREILLKDIKIYATALIRTLNAPIHPLDFRATVREIRRWVQEYQAAAGSHFDLSPALQELDALAAELAGFYGRLPGLATTGGPLAARANKVIRGLARLLVPVNYSKVERFRHDLALEPAPLPDIAPARTLPELAVGSHLYHVTLQHLTRGRNRLVHAVRQARELVREMI
jgi:hypothetical protein